MLAISSGYRVFIFAGAGLSAESGIPTFRDVSGLWRNYRIEEVASPLAWHRDPRLVWEFDRRGASAAKPNPAHFALAKLEDALQDREREKVSVCGVTGRRGILLLWRDRAMPGYYTERLAAERLRACYDLAPPRTKAYLEAEIDFVLARTTSSMRALELGCGYGRVLERLLPRVRVAFGIDTSPSSLCMALEHLGRKPSLCLACMDSVHMGFRDCAFDYLHSEWHLRLRG